MTTPTTRVNIEGILAIDKPSGITSYDVIRQLKKTLGTSKIGHCGTLDPLASGLLVVCVGSYTKFASYIESGTKEYIAGIKFGAATTTYDAEGEFLFNNPVNLNKEQIITTLNKFQGEILQTPPAYSAMKINGTPAYKLARKGLEVKLEDRKVTINSITLVDYTSDHIMVQVNCSKGTYIRSLAHDLGIMLGCGAYLDYLRRTKIGSFEVDAAVRAEDSLESICESFQDSEKALSGLPALHICDGYEEHIKTGKKLNTLFFNHFDKEFFGPGIYKIISTKEKILAIVDVHNDNNVIYKRVLIT